MYGFIAAAGMKFLETLDNGAEVVDKIHAEFGGEAGTNFYKQYDDQHTLKIVESISTHTGLTFNQVLHGMGSVQLEQFEAKGYMPLIKSLGRTFYEFLQHIDSLHQNLVNSYPDMTAPSFRPELLSGDTMLLHYYSSRPGLWPYALALLTVIADVLYDLKIEVSHQQKQHEGHDHDIFRVTLEEGSQNVFGRKESHSMKVESATMLNCSVSPSQFNDLFPWHIQFDRKLRVMSIGSSLAVRFADLEEQVNLFDLIKLVRPSILRKDFEHIQQYNRDSYMAIVRDEWYHKKNLQKKLDKREAKRAAKTAHGGAAPPAGSGCPITGHGASAPSPSQTTAALEALDSASSDGRSSSGSSLDNDNFISETIDYLYIKGEIVYLGRSDSILLVGVPQVSKPEELYSRGLSLADIPVHSNGREMLFSSVHQTATISIASQLEQTTEDLNRAQRELNAEKKKAQELLHSILPPKVAESLAVGEVPPAERFRGVSILFSDIVGFTKISSSVQPTQVMAMLNQLFSRFDALCDKHGVYKVETIGDAYMVVCGIPDPVVNHAEKLAGFAMDMVGASTEVSSPIDGSGVKIRVGMHSGSIMAGVVGKTRPRYCLFGDTVNVASRMESSGVPGCIQLSASMMSELHTTNAKVLTKSRGDVHVKGKGLMETFFLLGTTEVLDRLVPPESAYDTSKYSGQQKQAAAQPSVQMPMLLPEIPTEEPITFMELSIVFSDAKRVNVVGAASDMTLRDVLHTAVVELQLDERIKWRLYTDEKRDKMLVLAQTLGQVLESHVLPQVEQTETGANVLTLYASTQRLQEAIV
eukprot:m.351979 g.351979  ORF g.351979 m.351979 type:complete len:810 (+) comp16416_c0_seq1:338-2767(+)